MSLEKKRVATPVAPLSGPKPEGDALPQPVLSVQKRKTEIAKGTVIYHVKNLDLAVCLLSIGIPMRKDPPYTHVRLTDGTSDWTFHFGHQDGQGQLKTGDMIKAFAMDMEWIHKNPMHPMTFAMCAVKNLDSFKAHMARDVPYVGFKSPGGIAVLYVKEGSQKHKNCVSKGMVRVNPGD
jgi:hypothetical protein